MSCILPSAIKPVADKYGVGVKDIMAATYLYQAKYGLETYDENDPKYDDFIKDYFKIDKVFDIENENQFKKIIKIWNNTDNGIIKLTNPENKIAVVSVLAKTIGAENVVYFTDDDDNVYIRIAQPTLNGYTKEMLDIKEKAQKDGTFMKAPNGKPTNLTEKQWLQVRTKAFIKWFGDWIKIAPKREFKNSLFRGQSSAPKIDKNGNLILTPTYDELSKNTGVSFANVESAAEEYGHRYSKSPYIIEIDSDYLNKTHPLTNKTEKGNRFIGDEYGENAWEERISDTENIIIPKEYYKIKRVTQDFSKYSNMDLNAMLDEYEKLYNSQDEWADEAFAPRVSQSDINDIKEEINNREKFGITVNEVNTGKHHFDNFIHTVYENNGKYYVKEDGDIYGKTSIEITKDQYNDFKNGKGIDIEVKEKRYITNNNNSVSKVVDENGEPLAVYHHTDNPNLTEFSIDFENYFTKNGGTKEAIFFDENETGTLNRKYDIPVFLNIKDLKEYNETKDQLHQRNTSYRQIVNESAKDNNVDGGVHMKDFDDNKMEHQSIWIVHNPNQIKSATDNVGTFSRENNNIYASPSSSYEDTIIPSFDINDVPTSMLESMDKAIEDQKLKDKTPSSDPNLNEKFGNKTEITVNEILNNLLTSNSPFAEFIKTLLPTLGELGNIQIELVSDSTMNTKSPGAAGVYIPSENKIYINKNVNFKSINNNPGIVDNTILHEIVHAIVANSIKTDKHRAELLKYFDEARTKLFKKYKVSSFEELPEFLRKGRLYGLKDVDEFAAEFFVNSDFIRELNDEKFFGKRSDKDSLLNRIINWIKSLLPKGITKIYRNSGKLLEDIILNSGGKIQADRRLLVNKQAAANTVATPSIEIHKGHFTRNEVENSTDKIFLFGDNTDDRLNTHHVPSSTQAVIRGLPNAIGIDTKKDRGTSEGSYFTDANFKEFKKGVDEQLQKAIDRAIAEGKTIVIPEDGIGTGKAGLNTRENAKRCWAYLQNRLETLGTAIEVQKVVNHCKERFKESDNFEEDHTYILKGTDVKSQLTASSLGIDDKGNFFKVNKNIPDNPYGLPSTRLGTSTTDRITRDYLNNELKLKYPNLSEDGKDLDNILADLNLVQDWALQNGYTLMSADFPMMVKMKVDGEEVIVGGSMDLIAYNAQGDVIIIDIKNKRANKIENANGRSESSLESEYKGQQNGYRGMFMSFVNQVGANLKIGPKGLKILQFKSSYPAGPGGKEPFYGEWKADKSKQLYYAGKKIQELNDYKAPRLVLSDDTLSESNTEHSANVYSISNINVIDVIVNNIEEQLKGIGEEEKQTLVGEQPINQQVEEEARVEGKTEEKLSKENQESNDLHNSGISSSDILKLANNAINMLSYTYDGVQNDFDLYCEVMNINLEELTEEEQKETKSKFDRLKNIDRDSLFKEIPLSQVLNYIKEGYFKAEPEDFYEGENSEEYKSLKVAYDNFDALLEYGYSRMILLEKRTISKKAVDKEDLKDDGTQDSDINTEDVSHKDLEHWMIEQMSVKASLSGEWRRILAKIENIDENGDQTYDKWGFPEFLDENKTINNLLNWFKGCTKVEEMIAVLEKKSVYHKSYEKILNLINNNEQLKSSFFQNFRKDFQKYSIVIVDVDDDGKRTFTVKNINVCSATEFALNTLGYKFAMGFEFTRDLFDIRKDSTGNEIREVKDEQIKALKTKINNVRNLFDVNLHPGKTKADLYNIKENADALENLLAEFGITFPETVIRQALEFEATTTKNDTAFTKSFTGEILNQLDLALDEINKIKNGKKHTYSIFKENPESGEISIREFYIKILNAFEPYLEDVVEASSYENGKMHYAFNPPSYTGKMMMNFTSALTDPAKYEEFIRNEYGKYKWFNLANDEKKIQDMKFLCPILKMLNDFDREENLKSTAIDARGWFEHKVQLSYNKTAYVELGGLSYMHSILYEFFANSSDASICKAFYRIPIMSNKPTSEFIAMPRFKGKDYKDALTKYFFDVFKQEYMRMRTVLERARNEKTEQIKNFDITKKWLNKEKNAALAAKIKDEEKLATEGLTWEELQSLSDSGCSFKFLSFLNSMSNVSEENSQAKETIKQFILDYLSGKKDIENVDRMVEVEKAFGMVLKDEMKAVSDAQIDYAKSIGLYEKSKTKDKTENGQKIEGKEYFKYFTFLDFPSNSTIEAQEEIIDQQMENFVWNDMLASINIIELTATDLAYYKNMEDFQKRFAQIHAPGLRLNTGAQAIIKDDNNPDGNLIPVSDGFSRTMKLKDDVKPTKTIEHVAAAFDSLINKARQSGDTNKVSALTAMKSVVNAALLSDGGINVTDAQAFTSPTGIMKKLTMAGAFTNDMMVAYDRICSGNFDLTDLQVLIQPLKPFVYSQTEKQSYASTMETLKMGLQNKNSEYMILLADAIMRGAGIKDNKLVALFDFMESSAYTGRILVRDGVVYKDNVALTEEQTTELLKAKGLSRIELKDGQIIQRGVYNGKGIDTIQFESAVKVGLGGALNVNNKNYHEIIAELKSKSTSGISGKDYDDRYVDTFSYEDYAVQQEVPAHLQDHRQLLGSQERILTVSDMVFGTTIRYKGEDVKANDLINRYQTLIAENVEESFNELADVLGLKVTDRKTRNKKLSELLTEEISKDARYGPDLRRACELNSSGEFNIPLSDPIQSTRIQQLIHSIIKSRINKQKIAGGPVVQTTCWGMSRKYRIRFKDENRRLLEDEEITPETLHSLAYFECAVTVPTEELERDLINLAKQIDGDNYNGRLATPDEAVAAGLIAVTVPTEELEEEQLQAIGYRIPTEDKYSIYPMKIVEWMPRSAGEVVILPEEITKLTGSDFDIDKTYIVLKEFERHSRKVVKEENVEFLAKRLMKKFNSKGKEITLDYAKQIIKDWENENITADVLLAEGLVFKDEPKSTFKKERKVWYTRIQNVDQENKNGKIVRNNEIFDIQWALLTAPETMDKMFNPGSFDPQKRIARIVQILKATNDYSYTDLNKKSLDELEDIYKKIKSSEDNNILYISTQVKFFQQNMTAGKLIGIFANNNVSHAFIQLQNIDEDDRIKMNFSSGLNLSFAGTNTNETVVLGEGMGLDSIYALDGKTYISKNIAGFLAASVDAVKDPVLNYLNLNTFTSGVAMTLARLGFDVDSIGLFLSQPILVEASARFANKNNEGYASASDIIAEMLTEVDPNWQETLDQHREGANLTKEEMAKNLSENNKDYNREVLRFFYNLLPQAQALNDLTFLTKFNSMSNAAGPTIADNIIMDKRFKRFKDLFKDVQSKPKDDPANFKIFNSKTENVLENSPILNAFHKFTVAQGGAAELAFAPWFIQYTYKFREELLPYWEQTTKAPLDEKTINQLTLDYILYKLTYNGDTNAFFDTSREKRSFYINEFPNKFLQIVETHPDLKNNELIKIISVKSATKKCKVKTLEANTGGFASDTQEEIKNAWTDLLKSSNEEYRQLGRDLFFYCLMRNGFGFSPKTFIHLASVDVKLAMGYTEIIQDVNFNDALISIPAFIEQFKRNRSDNYRVVPRFKADEVPGMKLVGNALTITSQNENGNTDLLPFLTNEGNVISVIKIDGKLYKKDPSFKFNYDSKEIKFIQISSLGNTNNFLEYDANDTTGDDTKSVIGITVTSTSNLDNTKENTSNATPGNSPISSNETPKTDETLATKRQTAQVSMLDRFNALLNGNGGSISQQFNASEIEQNLGKQNSDKAC